MHFPIAATLLVLSACGSGPSEPDRTPSVLVTVVRPVRGALPATITAYGSASPSEAGTSSISMAQPGQLTSLAVTQGTAVRAGQVLGTFAVAPSARSAYLQAADALAAAEKQRRSAAQLLSQQLATSDQLVQADKAVADARTALAALAAEGAGRSVQTLTAPFAGIVTSVTAASGDRLQPGAAIMTLARQGGIVVTVGIDPAERGGVAPGQAASMKRLSGGGGIAGKVVRVDGMLNPKTRMVDVDLGFPAGALLPGEGMEVAIRTGDVAGWVVPHAAVVTAGGPARIFQEAGGKAKAVPVQVRLSSPEGDVVDGPVDPRRPIIVEGAYQVNDGDAVRWGR
ncbi:efflux RND transporter periplasmic adaptor subunit [Novosphingobium aerophilum]|uniref:efflux RND transporter periplasmic adaptor subunit n=1 Tax=Novosphingobium TaxID=165696 RepID=UPI0012CB6F68|nr:MULTISPECIES: efflux RND transporter periplasmic adaptor subunit [unclassified Novosphingobium]MPS69118.1 efflux RND transporter periplasmic adaptor subunit [Novosphingobium sp.]WRT94676.1 efflux RND transporter periplasmic adaptor subunit [Novosphingobium sp. RL4]